MSRENNYMRAINQQQIERLTNQGYNLNSNYETKPNNIPNFSNKYFLKNKTLFQIIYNFLNLLLIKYKVMKSIN